ncbi:MAG: hypothetical protein RBT69_02845 [Spirochaetia bacterium]|jgi:hypothetical protein|nr:hypothetical protein [Spirochaetia bacterium]
MKRIIIGIHGLKNKPPEEMLSKWWKEAILEGFEKNSYKCRKFRFDLVYWADINYESPQDPDEGDENDPRYLTFPFQPGLEENSGERISVRERLKKTMSRTIESGLELLFLRGDAISGIDRIADIAIKRMFADLDTYYHGKSRINPDLDAKEEFKARLVEKLRKYKKYKIMLVAHSMGSIIAYDTLMDMENSGTGTIDQLVTIGSPLGLPVIVKKILKEQGSEINSIIRPITPGSIKEKWDNLSDLDDKIALVYSLEKEFAPSLRGVKPVDYIVQNNYYYMGKNNPHKVYGYLMCPEFSDIAYRFVSEESLWRRFVNLISSKKENAVLLFK